MTRFITLLLALSLLSGCALFKGKKAEETEAEANKSAEKLFNEGISAMGLKNYTTAIEKFEALEARYPFGPYAQQAQLEIAYAYYKQGETDAAIAAADQFIKVNPRHPHVDYAYYLKGLADYHRHDSFFDRFTGRSPADLDTSAMENAFAQFKQLIKRFPNSRYAEDARQRMIHLRNLLARHEINVAKYYQKRHAWAAVAKRAAWVVKHYQGADAMPEALAILADAYDKLGMETEKAETLKIIERNYSSAE